MSWVHGLLLSLCVLAAASSWGQTALLMDLSNLPPTLSERLIRQHPGLSSSAIGYRELERILRDLILNEHYDAAEIQQVGSGPDARYRIVLGEMQKILSLDFDGNNSLGEVELRREFGLTDKSPFDQQLMIEAAERVRSFYEAQGFAQTRVDLVFERVPETGVKVKVNIHEGPRTTIQDFQFLTANEELAKGAQRALRSHRGSAINDKVLNGIRSDLRSYLGKNRYFRAEITDPQIEAYDQNSKARLIFQLRHGDRYSLDINGNRGIRLSALTSVLDLNNFSTSNPNVAAELATKVKNYYISQGYARAEVSGREENGNQAFEKIIRLSITEGPRVKTKRIDWIGQMSQPPKAYTDFLMDHASPIFSEGYFVKEDLDAALKMLVTDRWNLGYLRARVVSTRTSYNVTRDEISIQINFDEGPLTKIRSIRFEGTQALQEPELRESLLFKENEPLKLNALEESIQNLRRRYQDKGYLEMNLINERDDLVKYSDDNTAVDVVFQVYEGPQIQVGSIVVEGNSITRDEVIMKELEFKPGDTLTPALLDESISRLQRLGHFSSVDIRTVEEKTPISLRTVVVRVTDRDPGLFNLGFGVNSDRGLTVRGYTGIAYRNIGGTGRGVSARVDANYNVNEIKYLERKLTLGYLEPYLFDSRVRGRVSLTRASTVSDYNNRLGAEVNQMTYTLEQDLTSHVLLTWDVWSLATVRDFTLSENNQVSLMDIGSTALNVDFDFRDHPFNPTRGSFTRLNLEYGSPALMSTDTIEYVRSIANYSHYTGFKKWGLVWANSLRLGYLKNLSTRPDGSVPYDKKGLILGGQSTIRGFTPEEAFPNRYDFMPNYDSVRERYSLTTEANMYLIKSELRFPIWGNIGGAVFYDGGAVSVKGVSMETPYRHSAGLALRYSTPVGAASLEYAWKLNAKGSRGETPAVFHFSIGTF